MDEPLDIGLTEEDAAPALNEQGYLLQMRIQQALGPMPDGKLLHPCVSAAEEYPVTGGEEQLTRIDLVLPTTSAPSRPRTGNQPSETNGDHGCMPNGHSAIALTVTQGDYGWTPAGLELPTILKRAY